MIGRMLAVCVLLLCGAYVFAQSKPTALPPLPAGITACKGDFALCAASNCTPVLNPDGTPKMIRARTEGGGFASYPEMSCMCPILKGAAIADVNGGNMRGSCAAPSKNGVWSLYSFRQHIPQAINGWATSPLAKTKVTGQVCAGTPNTIAPVVNCFSFACSPAQSINGVKLADCRCPLGETLNGGPVAVGQGFITDAGQGNPASCNFAVGGPIPAQ
jgi:hypothetical protein